MATNTQRVAYNTSVQFIGQLVTSGLGLISVTLTTRLLGVSAYGQLTIAVVYLALYSTLTDAGISNITIRELLKGERSPRYIVGNILLLRAAIATLFMVVAIIFSLFIYHGSSNLVIREVILILSFTLVLGTIQNTLTSTLTAELRNDLIVIGDVLGKAVAVALIIVSYHYKLGVYAIAWATLAGAVVNCLSDLYFGLKKTMPSFKKVESGYMKKILYMSLPLGLAGILGTLYFNADGFLLSLFRGANQVGLYGVAYKFVILTTSLPVIFMTAVYPLMAASHLDKQRVAELTVKSIYYLQLAAAAVVVGSVVLAPQLVILLGGRAFTAAALPFAVLMVANYFVYTSTPYNSALLVFNKETRLMRVAGYALIFNVALNLVAIPLFGVTGAAASVLITEIVVQRVLRHYYKQYSETPLLAKTKLITLVNAGVMGVCVYLVKYALNPFISSNALLLIACLATGGIVYTILTFATRTINTAELRQLLSRGGNA